MPIALATTEVSLTASLWPPMPRPAPFVPDPGAVEAAGAGEAARDEIGPRIAAPATPPRISAPATLAFSLPAMRRAGRGRASGVVSPVAAGSRPQLSMVSFTEKLLVGVKGPSWTGAMNIASRGQSNTAPFGRITRCRTVPTRRGDAP